MLGRDGVPSGVQVGLKVAVAGMEVVLEVEVMEVVVVGGMEGDVEDEGGRK